MKKFFGLSLVLVFCVVLFTSCSGNSSSEESSADNSSGVSDEDIKVVYLGSRLGDNSVSDAIYAGFMKAEKEFGVTTSMIELHPTDNSKYKAAVAEAVDSGAQLIFGSAGSGLIDELLVAAEENPDIWFMCLDCPTDQAEVPTLPNFVGIMVKQNECSYLVGYLAAMMSETGKIGGIVGVEYPVLCDFIVGYIEGAKVANPDVQVAVSAIGDFVDQAKAKEMALAQYRQGCDVLYAIAGTASYGILEASKESGKWGIGVDVDMAADFIGKDDAQADVILTSAIKDWGYCSYYVIQRFVENRDSVGWGTVEVYDIANGGATYIQNEIYDKSVPDDIKIKMDELMESVRSGELEVPSYFNLTTDEYNALKESVKIN